jgi:co-chaperonin GroES (HSP10)
MNKNENLVIDRRRHVAPETEAIEKAPGMSIQGQQALAEAVPEAKFGETPVLSEVAKQSLEAIIAELKIRPPRGWVLIKKVPATERIGHILVPDVAQKEVEFGIVVTVGKGQIIHGVEIPMEVKMGNHVTFPPFAGVNVKIAGEELTQIREDEIMLIAGE